MDTKIRNILKNFITEDIILDEFTSPQTMSRWKRSLTHESINYLKNYEKYEFLGDGGVNYAFILYLRDDLGITKFATINNLLNYYMTKKYQHNIARKIGLHELVIKAPEVEITDDILEDVFESFFGVIEWLSMMSKLGQYRNPGSFHIRNFFRWYFSEKDTIDLTKGSEINDSLFNDLYYFLSRESPGKSHSGVYSVADKSFRFEPQFITSLSYYNADAAKEVRKILTQKGGEDKYYYIDKVIETLKSFEIDREWYIQEQERAKFPREIQSIATANKFSRFFLYVNEKGSYDLVAQRTDPKTRKSITEIIHSFDTNDFDWLKSKAMEIIKEKYSKH